MLAREGQIICVTGEDEVIAHAAKLADEIAERLSVDCPEEDLFAAVLRVASTEGSPARRARPPYASPVQGAALGGLAPGALRRAREYIEHVTE